MKNKRGWLILLAGAALASEAVAGLRPDSVSFEAGRGNGSVDVACVGAAWDWAWRHPTTHGEFTGSTEAYLAHWTAPQKSGRESFDLVALVPMVRWRGAGGRSPWFFEGGIGAMYVTPRFRTAYKQFTTNLNFADALGVGRNFGRRGQHEVSVRLSHYSNAGLRRPNPGQNILRLRYAYHF